jgi:hypothetical protein
MKARSMNARDEGACSMRVTLGIPAALGLRAAQAITFRMAAEFVEAMDPEIDMANYKGSIYVDHGVTQEGDQLLTFIVMEAMDEGDLRRAYAVADVVHDMTELLV